MNTLDDFMYKVSRDYGIPDDIATKLWDVWYKHIKSCEPTTVKVDRFTNCETFPEFCDMLGVKLTAKWFDVSEQLFKPLKRRFNVMALVNNYAEYNEAALAISVIATYVGQQFIFRNCRDMEGKIVVCNTASTFDWYKHYYVSNPMPLHIHNEYLSLLQYMNDELENVVVLMCGDFNVLPIHVNGKILGVLDVYNKANLVQNGCRKAALQHHTNKMGYFFNVSYDSPYMERVLAAIMNTNDSPNQHIAIW